MTRLVYNRRNKTIEAAVGDVFLDIVPVIKALHGLGNSRLFNKRPAGLVIHNPDLVKEIAGIANLASEVNRKFYGRLPRRFNTNYVNFGSEEVKKGNIPIMSINGKVYEEQVLDELNNAGLTWKYSGSEIDAEETLKKRGLPITIPREGLTKEEIQKNLETDYHRIDLNQIIPTTIEKYDRAMAKGEGPDHNRFKKMELDDANLGIGLGLYRQGILKPKLYI